MKILLLDADGVFVNFTKAYLSLVTDSTGQVFTDADITSFDIAGSLNLSAATKQEVTRRVIEPGFCANLEPIEGAVDAIQRIMLSLAEVYVVTSPWHTSKTWMSERTEWIRKHLGIPASHIIHTSSKHLVRGHVFVDDKTENCQEWDLTNPGIAVLWKRPWNAKDAWYGHRTNQWLHLEAILNDSPYDRTR